MGRKGFETMEAKEWDDLVRNDEGTRAARRALGAEIVLELDTTVTLDQYEGPASQKLVRSLATFGEVNNEAWKVAFLSHLEAYRLAIELDCDDDLEAVTDLIHWCRRAVGLSPEFATGQWGNFSSPILVD